MNTDPGILSMDELQPSTWKQAMQSAFTTPAALLAHLELSCEDLGGMELDPAFPIRVPRGYADRMLKGDPRDPLLRQVLPLGDERETPPGYIVDPLKEQDRLIAPGLIQKYHGRVLVISTGACAVHCRYCFRRHFPYQQHLGDARRNEIIDHIAADTSLKEVILSGGDPLMLDTPKLIGWLERLMSIPHVKRVRIHTRTPVVLPERVDEALLTGLSRMAKPVVMVLHANHPREVSQSVQEALSQLHTVCHSLWNQAVLLRGVNDSADVLVGLSEALFDVRVMPYYLNLLDPVAGAHDYDVPLEEGLCLLAEMRRRLPGYLCPRVVKEVPGELYKVPVELLEK